MAKHNDKPIGEILKQMVGELKIDKKLHETKIKKFWSANMGTTINNYTREIKLWGSKLYITIDAAPLRQELTYSKEKIKSTLNKELGEDFIEEVIIR